MIRHLLESPWMYSLTQLFWYRTGEQQRYVREWIQPCPGDRILDIGCGPGAMLAELPDVDYVGYDPSPRYIRHATQRFGSRGQFFDGRLERVLELHPKPFDMILANGVLHHVSDLEARPLLALAHRVLKPKGRMITRDGCFEPNQNRVAQFLLKSDRGEFVRAAEGYKTLFQPYFETARHMIRRDALRLPYSLIHFEWIRREMGF